MEVNDINDLIKLAGLVNSQAPTATAESEVEEADCGCSDEQPAAVMTNSPDMYTILKRLAQMGEVHEEEPVSEWSNSPSDELTGEPESRIMDLPKGEPVDTSLRRHMGANGQVVKVEEGIVDHTAEDMMESYAAFKRAVEDTAMPSKAEVMKCCKEGMSKADCCKKYPGCDHDKLKEMYESCMFEMKTSKSGYQKHKNVSEGRDCPTLDPHPDLVKANIKHTHHQSPMKRSKTRVTVDKSDEDRALRALGNNLAAKGGSVFLDISESEMKVAEDAGKVGHMEMFFTDRDGGEVSQEVEVTLADGKLSVTGNMPGPEDDLYWNDADIEEQLRDAQRDMRIINWINEDTIDEDSNKSQVEIDLLKRLSGVT